jgi:hypothetical protein
MINSRRITRAGYISRMEGKKNAYKILASLQERDHVEDICKKQRIVLKC